MHQTTCLAANLKSVYRIGIDVNELKDITLTGSQKKKGIETFINRWRMEKSMAVFFDGTSL